MWAYLLLHSFASLALAWFQRDCTNRPTDAPTATPADKSSSRNSNSTNGKRKQVYFADDDNDSVTNQVDEKQCDDDSNDDGTKLKLKKRKSVRVNKPTRYPKTGHRAVWQVVSEKSGYRQ